MQHSTNNLERMGETLNNRIYVLENRISRLEDNLEELDKSSKDYEKLKKNKAHKNGITRKCGIL